MDKYVKSKHPVVSERDCKAVISSIPESRRALRKFVHFLLHQPGSTAEKITAKTKAKNVRDLALRANQFLNKKGFFVDSYKLPKPKQKGSPSWAVFKK